MPPHCLSCLKLGAPSLLAVPAARTPLMVNCSLLGNDLEPLWSTEIAFPTANCHDHRFVQIPAQTDLLHQRSRRCKDHPLGIVSPCELQCNVASVACPNEANALTSFHSIVNSFQQATLREARLDIAQITWRVERGVERFFCSRLVSEPPMLPRCIVESTSSSSDYTPKII